MSVLTTSTDSITIADDAQSVAGSAGDALAWAEPVAPMRWRPGRATHLAQRGMATAEYAIGILVACQTHTRVLTSQDGRETTGFAATDSVAAWMTTMSPYGA